MLQNGMETCNCKKKKCERWGNCTLCISFHETNKYHALPYCKRKGNKELDKTNKNKHI